ncbi:MBL fold metallo-hydrolase [Thiosulfatihalobacter marinus]|uniref:MBL fold metallo-hydrolase n=1 Tax=Thiosulfatihalobacter marinus TaxID=2792481 RepID=UPI0018D963C0|nr:MBL fold metallo-hydrolase [Thiosulfatihalobacter marinus]
MKIRQIRNATLRLDYAGTKFLIDPWLAPKDTYSGFTGTTNDHLRNPTSPLVVPMEEIVNVSAVLLTHVHPDHWDRTAAENIAADTPFFVQHFGDKALVSDAAALVLDAEGIRVDKIEGKTFGDVRVLTGNPEFNGVKMKKVPGQHGSDEALQAAYDLLQEVTGIVFSDPDEKTVYLAGDTIWNEYVEANIAEYKPDVIIVNAGNAQIPGLGSIIMSPEDVAKVCAAAPNAVIIASHMESVNHAMTTRADLKAYLAEQGLSDRVLIPEDGETLDL